jgi:hypothetical protein
LLNLLYSVYYIYSWFNLILDLLLLSKLDLVISSNQHLSHLS